MNALHTNHDGNILGQVAGWLADLAGFSVTLPPSPATVSQQIQTASLAHTTKPPPLAACETNCVETCLNDFSVLEDDFEVFFVVVFGLLELRLFELVVPLSSFVLYIWLVVDS